MCLILPAVDIDCFVVVGAPPFLVHHQNKYRHYRNKTPVDKNRMKWLERVK